METARETASTSGNGGFSATKLSGIARLKLVTSYMREYTSPSFQIEDGPTGLYQALPSAAFTDETIAALLAAKLP
jgi:hypothetical protein